MSGFTFTDPDTGRSFRVKGGTGLSLEQARSVFDQQQTAGSLVGLKSGQKLDAASQALDGLAAARSQALSSIGDLGSGLNPDLVSKSFSKLDSVANLPVTDAMNVADYSLTAPALSTVSEGLSKQQITAGLGQASKLANQSYDLVSDAKGLGKYGLQVDQLETAGVLKPGTTSKYIDSGLGTVTDVLNSPSVYTGKSGIRSQDDLLGSITRQDIIQTGLMVGGIAALKSNGVPIDAFSGAAVVGTALVAAKGVDSALDWVSGKLDGGAIGTDLDQLARDGIFASGFGESKISDAMAQQFPALPAVDTVDRATLNAASKRLVGDPKVPDFNFSIGSLPTPSALQAKLDEVRQRFDTVKEDFGFLARLTNRRRPNDIESDAVGIYRDLEEAERLLGDLQVVTGDLRGVKREAEAQEPPATSVINQADSIAVAALLAQLESLKQSIEQRIEALSSQ